MGIKVVIGPVFHESLTYLDEMKNLTFLSLTNKTLDLPKNVISAGINATSQLNTIKKFISQKEIKKAIFLTPKLDYEAEIKTIRSIHTYLNPSNISQERYLNFGNFYSYKGPSFINYIVEKISIMDDKILIIDLED